MKRSIIGNGLCFTGPFAVVSNSILGSISCDTISEVKVTFDCPLRYSKLIMIAARAPNLQQESTSDSVKTLLLKSLANT